MAHRIGTRTVAGRTICELHDDATGSSAAIVPGVGFNLFDLRLPAAGRVWPLVVTDPDWLAHPEHPSRQGIPVLFPFPNRIAGARYTWAGRDYTLEPTKPPHAIHGFALDVPWEVVEHTAEAHSARIKGRFQISRHAPQDRGRWPSDAVLELTYTLAGRSLSLDAVVQNPGADPLPWGFGIHPYFRLPFDPGADQARTQVVIPARQHWVLDQAVPTGEIRPVAGQLDFQQGQPMQGLKVDDVLTDLERQPDGTTLVRLIDQTLGAEFQIGCGPEFRELVVFTPPLAVHGGVICIEPYTQATDAIHLQPRGIDGGLQVLAPGGTARMAVWFRTVG